MQSSNDVIFYIQQNILWNNLPTNVKSKINNNMNDYSQAVLKYSLENQLRFKPNLISKIVKSEKKYYEKLLSHSRENMFLYPYHLQDIMVSGLRTTPFMYYIDILCQIMSQEKSYDFIPNFTAADCLRLLGIGRNQYIDLMNNFRSTYSNTNNSGTAVLMVNAGRRFLGLSTGNSRKDLLERIRTLLPQAPVESIVIEPWWIVNVGIVLEPDIDTWSQNTKKIIDQIIDKGPCPAAIINREELKYLYLRGSIYFDVPIEPTATISVPTLEGFVMNRTTGDYFETLLYKIFVAIDENSTVENLSQILQIPLHLVQQAVSVFCRLQFAHKKTGTTFSSNCIQDSSWDGFISPTLRKIDTSLSPELNDMQKFLLEGEEDPMSTNPYGLLNLNMKCSNSMFLSPSQSSDAISFSGKLSSPIEDNNIPNVLVPLKKIAFIFDSSLTAYLMMGNLSVGLKNHAVTMFEVGKLSEESLDSFLAELDSVSDVGEGEAQRYYEHAVNLNHTIRKLRTISGHGVDLLRCGSLFSLDCASRTRMLTKNYKCLISMAPINYLSNSESISLQNCSNGTGGLSRSEMAISTNPELPHFGPVIPEVTSVWFKLFLYVSASSGPPSLLLTNGFRLRTIPKQFTRYSKLQITPWQQESVIIPMNCALFAINEALTHSPLLVQGYDFENRVTELHLVFPIDIESIQIEKLKDLVKKLDEIIDLSNKCGFISYLQVLNGIDFVVDIILLQIHFGIPLFDREINQTVLEQLSKMPILSCADFDPNENESLCKISNQYHKSTRRLTIKLLEFIDEYGGSNSLLTDTNSNSSNLIANNSFNNGYDRACSVSFSEISLPTKNLFFFNGKLEDYFF